MRLRAREAHLEAVTQHGAAVAQHGHSTDAHSSACSPTHKTVTSSCGGQQTASGGEYLQCALQLLLCQEGVTLDGQEHVLTPWGAAIAVRAPLAAVLLCLP